MHLQKSGIHLEGKRKIHTLRHSIASRLLEHEIPLPVISEIQGHTTTETTMTGLFAETAQEFIQYNRSAGFKYADEPKCLSRFCRSGEEQGVTEIEISCSLAEKWIAPREGESKKSRSHRITCIRQFAIYLNNLGCDAYIVPEVRGLFVI